MNAIILSAVWGVVMMISGAFIKNKNVVRYLAIAGAALLLIVNSLDMYMSSGGNHFFSIDTKRMLVFETFGLLTNSIAFASTLVYFLLSS
ncbi:MAG TPA: hypothetical protein VNV85_07270, partial [Puia sp.]|nr:hypothetical protein [Puia sp.]